MLLGLSGYLVGYNGSFEFESGTKYPPELNYTGMRLFAATFGALMVPIAYLTGLELHLSTPASILLSMMVLMGNAQHGGISSILKFLSVDISLLAISRFILLDPMLLFFTALSCYTMVTFRNYQEKA
jgi:dolichyl-phosphate-mannose-protein mannosyltransferase